jgi:D-aspartate ligase
VVPWSGRPSSTGPLTVGNCGDALTAARTSTPAVVLKLDRNVMHHGGLGVIRSLGRLGVPVYGVHEGPLAPAASSRFLQGRYFWNPGGHDAARIQDGLLRLADRIGEPAVLIATDDAGAIFLAEHGDALRSAFLFPHPPPDLPRRVAGKYSLYQLCRALGVPTPQAVIADSTASIGQFAAVAGFPLVAKLTEPWHGDRRLHSTTIIADRAALNRIWAACDRAGGGLMLQEFIPASTQSDWFFHGYCDCSSACRPAFTGIKERSYPARAGLTSLGRSAANDDLCAQVCRLLAVTSYRGIMDLDIRWDARDGQFKVLDFNPRLGAQFRLFADTAGVDVAIAQYLDLTGQEVPHGEQIHGRRLLVENYDPIAAVNYWRSGELPVRTWAASLRGVDETAWFARDDLLPFGLMCLRMGARVVSRPITRRDSRASAIASPVGRSTARYSSGRAARARARNGPGPNSTASHSSTIPQSTTSHSTVQHSTVQHSTVQDNTARVDALQSKEGVRG